MKRTRNSGASATGAAAGEGLHRRLLLLTGFRIALVTLLLIAAAVTLYRTGPFEPSASEQVLFAVIVVAYLASLIYALILRKTGWKYKRFAYFQLVGDVIIATSVAWLTGGLESMAVFLFPLNVVSAAVLLGRRSALFISVLSCAAMLLIVAGVHTTLLPLALGEYRLLPPGRMAFLMAIFLGSTFLTWALTTFLVSQAQSATEQLDERESDYYALELLHESIVRSITSGIVALDKYGLIRFANSAASRISGVQLQRALGFPLEQCLPELAARAQRAERERLPSFGLSLKTPSGEVRQIRGGVSPLLDREGRGHGCVISLEDLTELKRLEEAMVRSERLAAIGSMAAGIAHELRNPLASMSGSIQLLSAGTGLDVDEKRLLEIVLREADRLNDLVSEFLRYARPAPLQAESFALGDLVSSTVTLFKNDPSRQGIELEVGFPEPLQVEADAKQLGQVLWNLLSNAADAMPNGGRISIAVARRGEQVELAIRDQGVGIEPADLPRLFDPFFTTKERGTGLGLATVHSIIQGHGGTIDVESAPGKGSTFVVRLPLEREQGVG